MVTLLPNGDYESQSFSPNIDHSEGAVDAETVALTYGLGHALRQANTLFENGIYVRKIIVRLDPLYLLRHLKEMHFRSCSTRNIITELYQVVGQIVNRAGIELEIGWVPKEMEAMPHRIADEMVGEHQKAARVRILRVWSKRLNNGRGYFNHLNREPKSSGQQNFQQIIFFDCQKPYIHSAGLGSLQGYLRILKNSASLFASYRPLFTSSKAALD
jgi:hypothetical protein